MSGPLVTMHSSDVDVELAHLQLQLVISIPPVVSMDHLDITYFSFSPSYKAAVLLFDNNQGQLSLPECIWH